jgi:hypothetical protein
MPMDSYDPRNLIKAVHAAEQAGKIVVLDRRQLVALLDRPGRPAGDRQPVRIDDGSGSFGGWKKGNPIEQDMLDALLNFSGHLIVTMRTKTDYVIDNSGTKTKITKVGTKTVQREGTDYELGLIIDMIEGTGTVTKTRYEPLEGLTIHHPGEDLGRQILEQLGQGVDPVEAIDRRAARRRPDVRGRTRDATRGRKQRNLLDVEAAHPKTGEVMTLGEAIKAVGGALKPRAEPGPPWTSTPTAPEDRVRSRGHATPADPGSRARELPPRPRTCGRKARSRPADAEDLRAQLKAVKLPGRPQTSGCRGRACCSASRSAP